MNRAALSGLALISAVVSLGFAQEMTAVGLNGAGPLIYGVSMAEVERRFRLETLNTSEWGEGWCEMRRVPLAEADTIWAMFVDDRVVRVDVRMGTRRTTSDVGIGSSAEEVVESHGAQVEASPHRYIDGSYLTVRSEDGRSGFVFEVGEGRVLNFRAGLFPYVGWVEGCS